MTRMIAKAYRVADALRAAGIPVVMGGPHVTEVPDEALGRNGGPRHADAMALGEADETWPRIVADAARGQLKEVYTPVDAFGQERKPTLQDYPAIPWESLDLQAVQPHSRRSCARSCGTSKREWETFHIIPIESGRGCPYGCEFCTVTGFFGDSIRFRTNQSIVDEMLRLKERAQSTQRQDRGVLRGRQFRHQREAHQVAAARHHRGGRATLLGGADQRQSAARRGTARPDRGVGRQVDLHRHGVARSGQSGERQQELQQAGRIRGRAASDWRGATSTPSRRSFSGWTTIPRAWPSARWNRCASGRRCCRCSARSRRSRRRRLYDRLAKEGRLTRPKHWLEFAPFRMAHTPLKMTIAGGAGRGAVRVDELLQPGGDQRGASIRSRTSRRRTRSAT